MAQQVKLENNKYRFLAVSYSIIGSLLFFGFIGYFIDNKFETNYKLYFFLLGVLIAMYELYKHIFFKKWSYLLPL